MKALNLATLALSTAALLATYATAADVMFCTLGNPNDDVQTFSAGDKKTGTVCSIAEGKTLQFDGNTTPQIHANNTAATIELTYSNVGPRGAIWVLGTLDESTAATTVPYNVVLNNVIFNQDATLVIQGSFGKGSDISITGCSFNVGKPTPSFSTTDAFGILIFDNVNVHRLYDNGHLRLNNNVFNVISDPNNATASAIGLISQLKLGAGASVDISKNTIRVRNTEGGSKSAMGLALTGSLVPQGSGAEFTVISNTFETSYATPMQLPDVTSPTFSFNYNVSVNNVKANPCYAVQGDPVAAIFRPISLGDASTFSFSKNIITSNASSALVMTTSIALNDNAVASYTDNDLLANGGSPAFGMQGAVNIPSRGQLIMEFNTLRRNDTLPASITPFFFSGPLSLQGNAVFSVSHNDFDARNRTAKLAFLAQNGGNSNTKNNNAAAYACYNMHYTEIINSGTMMSTYISANILSLLNDVSTCVARQTTPPPTTTTTPTSTTTTSTTTPQTPVTGGTRATLPQATTRGQTTTAPTNPAGGATTTTPAFSEFPVDNAASGSLFATGASALTFAVLLVVNWF